MGESNTSRRSLKAAERRAKALEMRKLGLSYAKIGEHLGISRQAAYKAVRKELRKVERQCTETAAEIVCLELERLDQWQVRVEQEIKNGNVLPAIDRGLKITAYRARLLHLQKVRGQPADEYALSPRQLKDIEEMTTEELKAELFGG